MQKSRLATLIGVVFMVLVIAAAAAAAGYFYIQYQKTQKEIQTIRTDPNAVQKATAEENKKLIAEIGKLIDLPQGEDPTVATITDIDKLKDQPFFNKAKNGDKVLIYTIAKKAILYDANQKKILDVAPVNIGSSSAELTSPEPVKRVVTPEVSEPSSSPQTSTAP
jgi:hypothetical protein